MSKKTLLAILGIALVLGIGLTYRLMMMGTETNSSGTASIGGPFTLVNQDGETVTQDDFKGKYMLTYFGYTFCPDVCPTELQVMGTALDMMPQDIADEITPVFFTVDPERDTVEAVAEYVPYFHDRMVGLTGTVEQTTAAAKAFRVYYAKAIPEGEPEDTDTYLMDHSSFVYLMDREGKFVRHFNYGTSPEDMVKGVTEAVKNNG
ncbi:MULTISPECIES: SCO family protein [Thalassospira]|uniref:Electron transporter SenC n=2 Tax=Thalassospira tepidiphila TaxID=393657 RepID=A0A853L257_9PROT|nr:MULTISPECIES: SCO family protein [Thalassospira]NJB73129.1 protein SCO1/2 [Thalassospira tepidiphila]MBO6577590.1 SCO family protein [Thalassospira sp.]MBO6804799.1 SCO family protein [Thalassospira sp.]MBO6818025.1 SCO family protein [Thalassospira sp.]MBO6886660.1 SCO family protein [Thalassospira sp.]